MNEFDNQMRLLEQEYPIEKPVCFNYATARSRIFQLMQENNELRRALAQLSPPRSYEDC